MALKFTRLTRANIRALKLGHKISEHGITAERLGNGDVRWSVNFMVHGERIHRVVGLESERLTRTQAEEYIGAKRQEAKDGRLSLPRGRKTALSFRNAATEYIVNLKADPDGKKHRPEGGSDQESPDALFKDQRLDKITDFTIGQYKRKRLDAGATNATVNRELATLRHLFRKAVEWKWLWHRSIPTISMLKESEGRIIALTDAQCQTLMNAAIADEDPDCWLFVAFGLNTAMRHGEILAARFDQVDFDNRRLFIPEAKAGQRVQPLTAELVSILEKEREQRREEDRDGWIFPSPRPNATKIGHRHRMDKPFRRAVTAAGMDPVAVTPHVMRHTAITRLVQAGVDLPTIQHISGHKTLSMVQRYTHVHGDHIDRAMQHIGMGIPTDKQMENFGTITQELHIQPKQAAAGQSPRGSQYVDNSGKKMVPGDRFELPTRGFSIPCSTN